MAGSICNVLGAFYTKEIGSTSPRSEWDSVHIIFREYRLVYIETCVIDTSVTFHYNVCSKMMACT